MISNKLLFIGIGNLIALTAAHLNRAEVIHPVRIRHPNGTRHREALEQALRHFGCNVMLGVGRYIGWTEGTLRGFFHLIDNWPYPQDQRRNTFGDIHIGCREMMLFKLIVSRFQCFVGRKLDQVAPSKVPYIEAVHGHKQSLPLFISIDIYYARFTAKW